MGRLAGLRLGGMWVEAACVLPACKRTASVLQAYCKRTAGVLPAYCQLAAENIHIVQNARRLHAATPAGAPKANAPPPLLLHRGRSWNNELLVIQCPTQKKKPPDIAAHLALKKTE